VLQTEDAAMQAWEAETPREYVLRIYRFLNQSGYTVVGIVAAIEREVRKRTGEPTKRWVVEVFRRLLATSLFRTS
jgi:hypothetical protein